MIVDDTKQYPLQVAWTYLGNDNLQPRQKLIVRQLNCLKIDEFFVQFFQINFLKIQQLIVGLQKV